MVALRSPVGRHRAAVGPRRQRRERAATGCGQRLRPIAGPPCPSRRFCATSPLVLLHVYNILDNCTVPHSHSTHTTRYTQYPQHTVGFLIKFEKNHLSNLFSQATASLSAVMSCQVTAKRVACQVNQRPSLSLTERFRVELTRHFIGFHERKKNN